MNIKVAAFTVSEKSSNTLQNATGRYPLLDMATPSVVIFIIMAQVIAVSRKHLNSPLNYIELTLLSCLHTFRLFVTLGSEKNDLSRPSE